MFPSRVSQDGTSEEAFFKVLSNGDLWKEFKKYMYPNNKTTNFYDYRNGNVAASYGYLSLIKEKKDLIFTTAAIDSACEYGHLEVARYLYYTRTEGCTPLAMNWASSNNHLEVIKWLHFIIRIQGCTTEVMDGAIRNGHLKVVEFLHYNRKEGYNPLAMDIAARRGHLHVIKFLHYNRTEGCTKEAINAAAYYGHLKVVKFLRENRKEGNVTVAYFRAREGNQPEVEKHLLPFVCF